MIKPFSLFILPCLLLSLTYLNIQAQNAAPGTGAITDTTITTDEDSRNTLYTAMGYGSNMIYMGSTISQDHHYEYASLIYGLNDELFISLSGFHLNEINPFIAFYNATISYNHTVNSWFDYDINLSRYQAPAALADTLFSGFTYGDATLGFDWNILYTKVSLSGIFSEENRVYFQVRNSRYFETSYISDSRAYFSFDPYINLLFGSILKIETNEGTNTTSSPPYRPWKNGSQSPYSRRYNVFGPMELDFGLPVSFNYDFLTVEAETGYVLPLYSDDISPYQGGFVVVLSAIFRVF